MPIPGIGNILAPTIMLEIGDITHCDQGIEQKNTQGILLHSG
jgi:hypothetical protein